MLTHFSISQQGKSHIEKGVPCQDFSASKRIKIDRLGCELLIAAVADGVGSCEYSQFGSAKAVESFLKCVEYNAQKDLPELSDENVQKLIKGSFVYALAQIEKSAEKLELPFIEFDSTLTGIVYDGHNLWFGHIGDDGIVALYSDGSYEMLTKRHKGEEAHSMFPLREIDLWQFGKSAKEVASCVLMTDGVLDYCVDSEIMGNRVYFPFLEPALTEPAINDEDAEKQRLDWFEYLSGEGNYAESFRDKVTDDISFVVVQNPELVKSMPPVLFDFEKWDEDTVRRKKELDDALYADYRAYKAGTYQSPVEHVARHSTNETSVNKTVVNQPEEDVDAVIVDIYSDTAEIISDLIQTALNVGRYVRTQFTPKKRNEVAQDISIVNGDPEPGEYTDNSSDVKPEVPIIDDENKDTSFE